LLADAQAAADELVAQHFNHQCDASCGEWGPARKRADSNRETNAEIGVSPSTVNS